MEAVRLGFNGQIPEVGWLFYASRPLGILYFLFESSSGWNFICWSFKDSVRKHKLRRGFGSADVLRLFPLLGNSRTSGQHFIQRSVNTYKTDETKLFSLIGVGSLEHFPMGW